MAKVSGAAAYQQLQPVQDGLSQGAQYWGGIAANMAQQNQRQKAHEKAQRRAEKAAAKTAHDKAYKESDDKLQVFDTKNNDLNTLIAQWVFDSKDYNAKMYRIKDPDNHNATPEEKAFAHIEIQKTEQRIPILRGFTQGVTDHITAEQKKEQEGKGIRNPEYDAFMNSFMDLGKNGAEHRTGWDNHRPYIEYKEEGSDTWNRIDLSDVTKGKLPSLTPRIDYEATVKFYNEIVKNKVPGGAGVDSATRQAIIKEVEGMLTASSMELYKIGEDGKPTPELVSFLDARGINAYSLSEDQLEEAAVKLRAKFLKETMPHVQQRYVERRGKEPEKKNTNPFSVTKKTDKGGTLSFKTPFDLKEGNKSAEEGYFTDFEVIGDDIVMKGKTLLRKDTETEKDWETGSSTSKTRDVYAPLVYDTRDGMKEEINAVLSRRTGLDSYEENLRYLKGLINNSPQSGLPDLNDLPDLE